MTLFQSLITLREGIMIGDPVPIINNCTFETVFVVKSSDVRMINGKGIKMRRAGVGMNLEK